MTPLNLQEPPGSVPFSILVLGFRPFFLLGAIFSVVSMSIWTMVLQAGVNLPQQGLPAMQWHAHEMLYGFAMAIVAGFLLTAVKNWTGVQTLQHGGLLVLLLPWKQGPGGAVMVMAMAFLWPESHCQKNKELCRILAK